MNKLADDKWDWIISANLTPLVKMLWAMAPQMKKTGGRSIVIVDSKDRVGGAATAVGCTVSQHRLVHCKN